VFSPEAYLGGDLAEVEGGRLAGLVSAPINSFSALINLVSALINSVSALISSVSALINLVSALINLVGYRCGCWLAGGARSGTPSRAVSGTAGLGVRVQVSGLSSGSRA